MMQPFQTVFLALFGSASLAKAAATVSIPQPDPSAAVPISKTIVSLSIEFCYITDYLGDVNAPNEFSLRLLQNIQDLVGQPPVIRVGGDTQDHASYCESCSQTLVNVFQTGNTEAVNVTYNKGLYTVLNENAPSNQKFIFGVNLKKAEVSIPLAEVKAAQEYLNLTRLLSYELGNEPDDYGGSGWNGATYGNRIVDWIGQITAAIGVNAKWQIGAIAHKPASQGDYSIVKMAANGIPQEIKTTASFSDHAYPFTVCSASSATQVSLSQLMSHSHTTTYLAGWAPSIAAAKSIGIAFVIGETGSASCHGKDGVSNTLGAALWELDYVLHGATMGMSAVHFHMGTGFYYAMWQPVTYNGVGALVNPTYYAALFMATALGDLSNPYVVSITTSSTNLAIYAIYSSEPSSSSTPSKIVVLNLGYYVNGGSRQSLLVDLSAITGGSTGATVTRLTASTSDATSGVTFGGQSWEGNTGVVHGTKATENLSSGQVTLLDSEAVLVKL